MKMKSMLGMYALAAMAMSGDINNTHSREYEPKESEQERKDRLAKAEIERNKANGMREFFYGKNSVWAINQKNADKKARKQHWL